MKGDHRILGDSAFVMEVLAEAEEKFECFYSVSDKDFGKARGRSPSKAYVAVRRRGDRPITQPKSLSGTQYELKSKGYNLDTTEQVCEIFGIEPDDIYSKSRQKTRAEARGLYCYWAVVELGYPLADLARLLGMTG